MDEAEDRRRRLLRALATVRDMPFSPIGRREMLELLDLGLITKEERMGLGASIEVRQVTPAGRDALATGEVPPPRPSLARRLADTVLGLRAPRKPADEPIELAAGTRARPAMERADTHPIAIVEDRYGGTYSGGAWIAIARADSPCSLVVDALTTRAGYIVTHSDAFGDDASAMGFWADPPEWVAAGDTPQEAVANLKLGLRPSPWPAGPAKGETSH